MKRSGLLLPVILSLVLPSCGGGGGSSSAPSPYTGITTPAVITPADADNIVLAAYQGADVGASLSGPLGLSADEPPGRPAAGRPGPLSIVQTFSEAAEIAWSRQRASTSAAPRAVTTVDDTIYDGFGGSFRYSLSVDDQTGAFSGVFTFSNYHGDGGAVFSGAVSVSGTFDMNTSSLARVAFSFQSIAMTDAGTGVTVSGTLDLYNGNPSTAVLNLYATTLSTGKTVWIDNFTIDVTDAAGYCDVTMSGKIYLQEYGYVIVSTATPLRYATGDTYPSAGVMMFTGSSDGRARLTVESATSYTVDVDANGDGTWETSSSHTWI